MGGAEEWRTHQAAHLRHPGRTARLDGFHKNLEMSRAFDLSVGRVVTIVAAWITSVKCSQNKRAAFRAGERQTGGGGRCAPSWSNSASVTGGDAGARILRKLSTSAAATSAPLSHEKLIHTLTYRAERTILQEEAGGVKTTAWKNDGGEAGAMPKKQTGQPERLWTVDEVATHVGVNIETVRRWLRTGALRGIRLGTKAGWRIRQRDLDAYLEQRTPVGQPAMPGGRARRGERGAVRG